VEYCIVLSVGYSATVMTLWEFMALVWSLYDPAVLGYAVYGPLVALLVFLLGSAVNCAFQMLGNLFSLQPSTSITIGWSLLSLGFFLMVVANNPPLTLADFVKGVIGAAQALANNFPSSKLFYDIGNATLALVGIK